MAQTGVDLNSIQEFLETLLPVCVACNDSLLSDKGKTERVCNHKRFPFCQLIDSGESQCHAGKMVLQLYEEVHVTRNNKQQQASE